jgi:hypothetical protein
MTARNKKTKIVLSGSEIIIKINRLKRDKIVLYNQTVLLREEVTRLRGKLKKKANMAKKKSIWTRTKSWLGF